MTTIKWASPETRRNEMRFGYKVKTMETKKSGPVANLAAITNETDQASINTTSSAGAPGQQGGFHNPIGHSRRHGSGVVSVINDLTKIGMPIREFARPQRPRRVRHFAPPTFVHDVVFFETHATLDSAKSSKVAVNLAAHCHYAGQSKSATARTVKIGILVNDELITLHGHIRPKTFVGFFYRHQLEAVGITLRTPFRCTLLEIEQVAAVTPVTASRDEEPKPEHGPVNPSESVLTDDQVEALAEEARATDDLPEFPDNCSLAFPA